MAQPSVEETIQILNGIKPRYQDYHHVQYTDEAIEAAAKLSDRYIQDRFLPDKAIDLLDEAGSRKNLTLKTADPRAIKSTPPKPINNKPLKTKIMKRLPFIGIKCIA